jgi:hypothetical protein
MGSLLWLASLLLLALLLLLADPTQIFRPKSIIGLGYQTVKRWYFLTLQHKDDFLKDKI